MSVGSVFHESSLNESSRKRIPSHPSILNRTGDLAYEIKMFASKVSRVIDCISTVSRVQGWGAHRSERRRTKQGIVEEGGRSRNVSHRGSPFFLPRVQVKARALLTNDFQYASSSNIMKLKQQHWPEVMYVFRVEDGNRENYWSLLHRTMNDLWPSNGTEQATIFNLSRHDWSLN